MSKDVELTDKERRVISEIERYEGELRSEWPATRGEAGVAADRRDPWAWAALVVGTSVLIAGLPAYIGLIPFAGFVILLAGATRLSLRLSATRWLSRRRNVRRSLSGAGSPGDAA
jgi:hypothetical protein